MPMSIQYSIDRADRIQFINEAWLQFACQNAGGHLNRAHVIGKPLWEFIKGEDLSPRLRPDFQGRQDQTTGCGFQVSLRFRGMPPVFSTHNFPTSGGRTPAFHASPS